MIVRTQSKFLFLIGLVSMLFLVNLFYLWQSQKNLERDFFDSSRKEKTAQLAKVIDLTGKQLETLTDDYSWWDEMISFARNPDTSWAHDNILTGLGTFNASAAWVLDPAGSLIYSVAAEGDESLTQDKELLETIQGGLNTPDRKSVV